MTLLTRTTTGLKSLDGVFNGLRLGDNVVWQVDEIEDYVQFVQPFAKAALAQKRRLVYLRFARHAPILEPGQYDAICQLDAFAGFESFSTSVHGIISREGVEVFYVFDCLSDLQSAWATDLMTGNFFSITCPYLFELNTVAYFAILRNSFSYKTIARIRETTQLLIDVYNLEGNYYVHPLKVWNRYSPTMFFPHLKKGDALIPVTSSVDAGRLVLFFQKKGTESTLRNLDYWDRIYLKAEELASNGGDQAEKKAVFHQLCRFMIGRDERILSMIEEFMTLEDLIEIKERLIGTGFIGGKAVGMLLARKILARSNGEKWGHLLEPHDSFYIGSDVFYTYIVQNGWWKLFMSHKTDEGYFPAGTALSAGLLNGTFPDEIKEKFLQIIEYFGQSPIIVRSSSLLEDAFGNAFAGKYESHFLVNQGSPEERYSQFVGVVQKIFASSMNEDALTYRMQRGLHKLDEQMALLVQRVSGSYNEWYFFPDIGGVGMSYNTFIWKNTIDPKAGMLRLVFGLGTRAVNRVEGDYPRIVALDDPLAKPHAGMHDARRFSQHEIDLLNVAENVLETKPVPELLKLKTEKIIDAICVRDTEIEEQMRERGIGSGESWIVNFDNLLSHTSLADEMKDMLGTLEAAYRYPVDIEFTVNFNSEHQYRVNLLQCRPLQTKWEDKKIDIPKMIEPRKIFFQTDGNFLGGSVVIPVSRIIYVKPSVYGALTITQQYDIARVIGKLNRLIKDRKKEPTMLLGPGRWGTTTPSLGVPIRFSEINNFTALVEIALMREDMVPELSYGTHFFQDLVETEIFYVAIFPEKSGVRFNETWMEGLEDKFAKLLPNSAQYSDAVSVFDVDKSLYLMSDIVSQKLVCFENTLGR